MGAARSVNLPFGHLRTPGSGDSALRSTARNDGSRSVFPLDIVPWACVSIPFAMNERAYTSLLSEFRHGVSAAPKVVVISENKRRSMNLLAFTVYLVESQPHGIAHV
jgi:hypothetical protein